MKCSTKIKGALASWLLAAAFLALAPAPGRGADSPETPQTNAGRPAPQFIWLIANGSARSLCKANAALAKSTFNHPSTYIGSGGIPDLPEASAMWTFASFAAFQAKVKAGALGANTKAVMYDPEGWKETPPNEQQNVGRYLQQFCELAHQHGWLAITTPSVDLMTAKNERRAEVYPHPGKTIQEAYLDYNLAALAARYADFTEIQAQALQLEPAKYADFVKRAKAQALAANPKVKFLSGLSAYRNKSISPAELCAAANSVRDVVDGFYLAVKNMDSPNPENVLQFIQMFAGKTAAKP